MKYNSYTSLQDNILEEGDDLDFNFPDRTFLVTVRESFFHPNGGDNEGEFFDYIDIDKNEFADKAYGYPNIRPNCRGFPDYKRKDMKAATRIALAIFEYIETKYKPSRVIELSELDVL